MVWVINRAESMMSLRNKLIQNFTLAILISILIFSISISMFINKTMTQYLVNNRNMEFEKIKNEFEDIFWTMGEKEVKQRLLNYSMQENVYIEIFNMKNESIAKFNGIDESFRKDSKFVTKEYSFYSPETKQYFGYLLIGYIDDSYKIDQQTSILRENIVDSILITIAISGSIGFLLAIIFSRSISRPIQDINKATKRMTLKDYSIKLKHNQINEIDDLTNNIMYLSKNLDMQEKLRLQYAQDISHELRTPLTNLTLHLEAIQDQIIEANEENIEILLGEVKRLNDLVTNLKKTFDDNSEFIRVQKQEINLSKLLKNIGDSLKPRFLKHNINFIEKIEDNVTIKSDADKLRQIMYNLLTNAIKAIGSNGEIRLILKTDKKNIYISVKDNGVGIEKEKLNLIFDRFYRIDDARNTKSNGHGLGLSITKTFVQALKGQIDVKSKIKHGSTFTIIFRR